MLSPPISQAHVKALGDCEAWFEFVDSREESSRLLPKKIKSLRNIFWVVEKEYPNIGVLIGWIQVRSLRVCLTYFPSWTIQLVWTSVPQNIPLSTWTRAILGTAHSFSNNPVRVRWCHLIWRKEKMWQTILAVTIYTKGPGTFASWEQPIFLSSIAAKVADYFHQSAWKLILKQT